MNTEIEKKIFSPAVFQGRHKTAGVLDQEIRPL